MKILNVVLISSVHVTGPVHSFLKFGHSSNIWWIYSYKFWSSSLCSLVQPRVTSSPLSTFSGYQSVLKQPQPCPFFRKRDQLSNSYNTTQTLFIGGLSLNYLCMCFCCSLYSLHHPRTVCLSVSLNRFAFIALSGLGGTVNALLHYWGPI
jgi:hypothetical protein